MANYFMDFDNETINQLILREKSFLVLLENKEIKESILRSHHIFFKDFRVFKRDLTLYTITLLSYLKTKNKGLLFALETMKCKLDASRHYEEGFCLEYLDYFKEVGICPIDYTFDYIQSPNEFKSMLDTHTLDIIPDGILLSLFEDYFQEEFEEEYDCMCHEDSLLEEERFKIINKLKDELLSDFESKLYSKSFEYTFYSFRISSNEINLYLSKYNDSPKKIDALFSALKNLQYYLIPCTCTASDFNIIKDTSPESEFTYFIDFIITNPCDEYSALTLDSYKVFLQQANIFKAFFDNKL